MVPVELAPSPDRVAIVGWTARMGAVTAESLAARQGITVVSARARLGVLEQAGWLSRARPLAEQPALYAVTRAGLHISALRGLDPCRVSASNAHHMIVCALAAAVFERRYPDYRVLGERELRRDERECGLPLASARINPGPDGRGLLHRPDLVLWPHSGQAAGELPVAVEVELTVKAPRRLTDICRAWGRCRCVAGVIYLASPEVKGALDRAIDQGGAAERIVVVELGVLDEIDEQ